MLSTILWPIIRSITTEKIQTGVRGLTINLVCSLCCINWMEIARSSHLIFWNRLYLLVVSGMIPGVIGHL
jgi:hypothetical protein